MSTAAPGSAEVSDPAGGAVLMSAAQVAHLLRAQEDRSNRRIDLLERQHKETLAANKKENEERAEKQKQERQAKAIRELENATIAGLPLLAERDSWLRWREQLWTAVGRKEGLLPKWNKLTRAVLRAVAAGEDADKIGEDGKSPNENLNAELEKLDPFEKAHLRGIRGNLRLDGSAQALVATLPEEEKTLWNVYRKLVRDFGGLSAPAQNALHERFMTEKYDPSSGPLSVWLAGKFADATRLSECTPPKLHPETVDQNMISLITGKLPESFEPVVSQVRTRGFQTWGAAADIVVSYDENLRVAKKTEVGALTATTNNDKDPSTTPATTAEAHLSNIVAHNQCRVCWGYGHKSFQCPSAPGNQGGGWYSKNGGGGGRFRNGQRGKGGWDNNNNNRVRKGHKDKKGSGKNANQDGNPNASKNGKGKAKGGKKK